MPWHATDDQRDRTPPSPEASAPALRATRPRGQVALSTRCSGTGSVPPLRPEAPADVGRGSAPGGGRPLGAIRRQLAAVDVPAHPSRNRETRRSYRSWLPAHGRGQRVRAQSCSTSVTVRGGLRPGVLGVLRLRPGAGGRSHEGPGPVDGAVLPAVPRLRHARVTRDFDVPPDWDLRTMTAVGRTAEPRRQPAIERASTTCSRGTCADRPRRPPVATKAPTDPEASATPVTSSLPRASYTSRCHARLVLNVASAAIGGTDSVA